jgi:hypothetical protein
MRKKCKTCHQEFDVKPEEFSWKNQCWDCYKTFKGKPRIWPAGGRIGKVILSHPSATKEEIDAWILRHYGSVNCPENWGAAEIKPDVAKVWWNNQNCD